MVQRDRILHAGVSEFQDIALVESGPFGKVWIFHFPSAYQSFHLFYPKNSSMIVLSYLHKIFQSPVTQILGTFFQDSQVGTTTLHFVLNYPPFEDHRHLIPPENT
jgi:hypothetical protein